MAHAVPSSDEPGRSRSAMAVLAFGLALAAILAAALVYVAAYDRRNRLAAAEQQNLALATGAQRLVWLQLRNLERALLGIAGDARRIADESPPEKAERLIAESIADVARRQQELESIVLVDAGARVAGRGDAARGHWPDLRRARDAGTSMRLGPMDEHGGQWLLPLAVPMRDDRWILARLRTTQLQQLLEDLDFGRTRLIQLVDAHGRILADSRGPTYVGRKDDGFVRLRDSAGVGRREVSDPHDRVARSTLTGAVPGYPLHVNVGISRAAVLAPWWRLVTACLALYVLYLFGLAYLVRVLQRNSRDQAALVRRLTETAEGLRLAQELGRTGTWAATRDGVLTWSGPVAGLMGLHSGQTSATAREFYELMHPDDRERVAAQFADAWRSGQSFSIDYRIVGGDGGVRWISARGASVAGEDGGPVGMTGTVLDITRRMQAQQRLEETERQFRLLFERNPLPFWVFDVETLRFVEVNEAALAQYGYTREEFLAMTILDIRPQEHRERVIDDLERHQQVRHDDVRVWVHRRKGGGLLEVRVHATDIEFRGRASRLVLAEDVTERMGQQRELAYRASHDMTSGLLNADALAEKIESLRPGACRIACVQLRGLELIEDSLGREAGHETLRAMATRIARLGERFGSAGHVRGDEFALVVCPATAWDQALDQLLRELARPIPGEDTLHRLESWIGVADLAGDVTAAQAIGNAGLAAHVARTEHRPIAFFEAGMARHASDRLKLAGRIHRAIDAGEFELHFQILWDVARARPGGMETLIRWPQRGGGFVPPSQFIGLCEDTGLIVPLGRWALREAAAAQRQLARAGFADQPVAVNVSLMQFLDGGIADDIESVIEEYGLPPGALHIELTESVLMTRPEQALDTLRRLQSRGVCISLDDFGTGFSSMSYLKQLPLDAIKIDQSFVRDVHRDQRSASICEALLALGHGLGLKVAGEGVETQEQFEWLRRHGCDRAQGFGIHRPEPLAQAIERLREMHAWADGPWRRSGTDPRG